jgi:hypothetical protein
VRRREEGCEANSEGDEGSDQWARLRGVDDSRDTAGILGINTRGFLRKPEGSYGNTMTMR